MPCGLCDNVSGGLPIPPKRDKAWVDGVVYEANGTGSILVTAPSGSILSEGPPALNQHGQISALGDRKF